MENLRSLEVCTLVTYKLLATIRSLTSYWPPCALSWVYTYSSFPISDLSPHFILLLLGQAGMLFVLFFPTPCVGPGQTTWPWQSQNNVRALTCLLSEPRLWKISRVFTLWLQVLPSAAVTQLDPEGPETEQNIAMILMPFLVMVSHKSPVIA